MFRDPFSVEEMACGAYTHDHLLERFMDYQAEHPRVGIGVMILKDGKVLLGRRKGSHGAGQFAFPGGHLEYLEAFEECARREVREECGIEIANVRFQFVANLLQYHPKHYVHIGLIADWKSGDPRVMEEQKCESWGWFEIRSIPDRELFAASRLGLVAFETGQTYFDAVEAQRRTEVPEFTLGTEIA